MLETHSRFVVVVLCLGCLLPSGCSKSRGWGAFGGLESGFRFERLQCDGRVFLVLIADGCSAVVLLPLTRGLHPNVNLATAICAATNAWLADRYLATDPRLYGTIRVEPRDPIAAVAEIERWAGHPQIVQVGVPTQSLSPYGSPAYLPIWRDAAARGLPIAVHTDGGSGV